MEEAELVRSVDARKLAAQVAEEEEEEGPPQKQEERKVPRRVVTPEQVIYAANQEGLLEQHPLGLDTAVTVDHNAPSLADVLHASEEKVTPHG